MMTFIVGVVVGIVLLGVAARHASLGSYIGPWLAPGRNGERSESLSGEALDKLRREAPGLADRITKPAKVDPADVPAEVKAEDHRDAVATGDLSAVREHTRRFIRNPDVAELIAILLMWNPARRQSGSSPGEKYYERSLMLALKRYGFDGRVDQQPRLQWSDGLTGSRPAQPDLTLRGRVLVEIKADLTQADEADRAMGQMLRYLLAWRDQGPAVLVVCGEVPPIMRFLVRHYVDIWRGRLGCPITVFFKRDDEPRESVADFPEEQDDAQT
jgi:PD-(D/E)XK nuclease superfamily